MFGREGEGAPHLLHRPASCVEGPVSAEKGLRREGLGTGRVRVREAPPQGEVAVAVEVGVDRFVQGPRAGESCGGVERGGPYTERVELGGDAAVGGCAPRPARRRPGALR